MTSDQTSTPSGRSLEQLLPDVVLSDSDLRKVWSDLTGWDPYERAEAWQAFEDALAGTLSDSGGLRVRPGGWSVDLHNSVARTVVAAGLIGASMWPAGLDQLPAYILPAVLPLLFDISRSRLSRRDRELLVELRLALSTQDLAYPWPASALYQRLPANVRDQVSPADFADFIDQLVRVGVTDDAGFGEVRLRDPDRPAWLRITVR